MVQILELPDHSTDKIVFSNGREALSIRSLPESEKSALSIHEPIIWP